ncbi:MAG: tRNA (adenosine(37)-N6)-threonylcarbamoyltransferase complex dimerization subunit type 1 TsaB [Clostridiales bacterium]|jgi:tRNA threonylcarbamoyladenosine biosynthesis protein TsaB|nr:tRNA (adenosine(37)-N6)-threonylcarbamoyltransferase complex dimerization subunit type 1 TsaB [Clostridiales bacterium]
MKILAIESSGLTAGVAVVDELRVIGEFSANHKLSHSQTLMPMIDMLLALIEMSLEEMDAIACSSGPGSFTGLRIGASTAKALAYAANKPIAPVPTIDALAYNVFDAYSLIAPVMDARRSQVYTSVYEWASPESAASQPRLARLSEYAAESVAEAVDKCAGYGRKVIFAGDGAVSLKEEIKAASEKSGLDYSFAPCAQTWQRAASVGFLGIQAFREDATLDSDSFKPFYLRQSQAERELAEKARAQLN